MRLILLRNNFLSPIKHHADSSYMAKKPTPELLVVDDDQDCLQAIAMMLETLGYSCRCCGSPEEALKAAKERPFDLVLLDIMMPGMNGYQLLENLRALPNGASAPAIMVTAKDEESGINEVYEHGADYYITKPFTAKQLESRIKLFL